VRSDSFQRQNVQRSASALYESRGIFRRLLPLPLIDVRLYSERQGKWQIVMKGTNM
jgi:hypothetical protein